MVKVTFKGLVIAESDKTVFLEGNHYFPPDSVKVEVFSDSETKYTCPWKGAAVYRHATVNGKTAKDIAWIYPDPKPAAIQIKGHYAFDKKQVTIS